jgi:hypothetical protein
MHAFEIHCADSGVRLLFTGNTLRGLSGYAGCDFEVSLIATPLSASVRVYDLQPQRWSEFFADLAAHWQGGGW